MISRRSLFSTIAGFAASLAGVGSPSAVWDWRYAARCANVDYDILPPDAYDYIWIDPDLLQKGGLRVPSIRSNVVGDGVSLTSISHP